MAMSSPAPLGQASSADKPELTSEKHSQNARRKAMKRFLHQPGRLTAVTVLVLLLVSLVGTPTSSAAPLQQGTINKPYVSNVRHNAFVVSWTTQSPCTSEVRYGTSSDGTGWLTVSDSVNTTTHYVTVSGLNATTLYYFDTYSNGVVNNNGGAHFTVTTGANPGSALPGTTVNQDVYYFGTTTGVPYAIAYIRVRNSAGQESQLASARTQLSPNQGRWFFTLPSLRTANHNNYFNPAEGDTITVTVQGGDAGWGQVVGLVPAGPIGQLPPITLNNSPTAVGLSNLTARTDSITWLPIGFILLGATAVIVMRRRSR
jgi:hypothetical protein